MASRRTSLSGFMIYGVAIVIAVGSLVIIAGSLLYSNHLVKNLAEQEAIRVKHYSELLKYVALADPECETSAIFEIIKANQSIPTVLVDAENNILDSRNVSDEEDPSKAEKEVQAFLERMIKKGDRVEMDLGMGLFQYVYYDESTHLKQLRLFPYLQLVVIGIFILVIFVGFSVATKNEQNKVWVGLAKETAHQLGTPVSSMMAWVELLKLQVGEKEEDMELILELQKDVKRLEMITERFSKIGSKPELNPVDFQGVLNGAADYMRLRMPKRVKLEVINDLPAETEVALNRPLFEWVIENLLKNALDAIEGDSGRIAIHVSHSLKSIFIDVQDSGKGIPGHLQKRVFKPGFTTKKRGWGLGLSLVRRIVENYHNGKIFVKESTVGEGTVFRIILPKNT